MTKNIVKIIILVFISVCLGCSNDGDRDTQSDIDYQGVLFTNDDFFTGSHWNDPHVINRNGTFEMYASSDSVTSPWDGYVRIFRFTSTDGKKWTISNNGDPVLALGTNGEWDEHSTETPAVVYFNNQYHMFYTGYDVAYDYTATDGNGPGDGDTPYDDDSAPKHFRIGHATSTDGINWVKKGVVVSPTNPYTAPNLDFNQSVIGEPAPVVFNNQIYLYFTAVGAATEVGTTWQTIGLIKSTNSDATTWTSPTRVLTPDLNIYPRTTSEQYLGYSTPNAVVIDNVIHLYFDVVLNSPWTQDKIHHAYSVDGESNWVQDSSPLLDRDSYYWTASEIRSPSALVYDNKLYLYFAGHYFEGADPILKIGLIIYNDLP